MTIEGTSLIENRDEVAKMGGAGRGIEASVLVHEPLERVEELKAPPRVGSAGDVPAGDI